MKQRPKAFWIILTAGIILRLILVFALPLYPEETFLPGYNDEPMHLNYVRYIAENKRLPVWTEEESKANPLVDEFPQSPLYYVIAAPAYRLGEWIKPGGGIIGARMVSVLFGVAGSLIVYWICLKIIGKRRAALAGMAFVTFSPNMALFTSLVTNDSLLYCLSALSFASIIALREFVGGSLRQIKTGLVLGLAVWAKISALSLYPLAWLVVGEETRWRDAWRARLRVFIAVGVVILPLVVWNLVQYGQFIPTVSITTPEESRGIGGAGVEHPVTAITCLARTAAQPLEQVWGSIPEKLMTTIWVVIGAIGLSVGALSLKHSPSRWLIFWGLLFPVAALIFYNFRFFQIEARLLFPAMAPLAVIVAAGMSRLKIPIGWQCVIWGAPLIVVFGNKIMR